MRAKAKSKTSSDQSAARKTPAARPTAKFSARILARLKESKILRIRAGMGDHRFIGIWLVLVGERVFVRSWSVRADGWYQAFRKEPRGAIQLDDRQIEVRARAIGNAALRDAIDQAYLAKYNTKGSLKYARDLGSRKSRATTLELTPR